MDRLDLTEKQRTQIDALQKEVDTRLAKILNNEQKQTLENMRNQRSPRGPDGRGGPDGQGRPDGPGGPGRPEGFGPPDDPEMQKLNQSDIDLEWKCRDLVIQYRRAPQDKQVRATIKKQIEDAALQHFEVRQQRRALELKRLEEQVQRIREAIESRNKSKEAIVNRRVAELMDEKEPQF